MPITNIKPFNAYTGNGSTTQFAYQFYLLDKDDLAVMVDGIKRPAGDYTITGVGNNGGGNVTFNTAPADKAKVLIQRQTALKRDTDYALNGDMIAQTVNADFDRLWALGQELADESGRALVRPAAGVNFSAENHEITDLSDPKTPQSAATKAYVDKEVLTVVTDIVDKATAQANIATNQAGGASTSAQQAAASASAAATSAQNAARSEGNANTSKNEAAGSAAAAAGSASTASTAASQANQSAGQAQGFATGAQSSATGAGDARTAAQQAASLAQTQAGNAADSARQAAGSAATAGQNATAAGQQADRAKTEADRAQTANPDNQLKKAQNLADVPDKLAARFNMGLGSFVQNSTATGFQSPDAHNGFSIDNSGDWGANDVHGQPIPLTMRRGGTAGLFSTQGDISNPTAFTIIYAPDKTKRLVISSAGAWGAQDASTGLNIPLPVYGGGTGHTQTLNNLTGSIDDIAETGEGCVVGTSNGGIWPRPAAMAEWAFIRTQVHADSNYRSQTLRYFVNNLQYRRERGTGGWGGWVKSLDAGDYGIGGRGIILSDADLGQANSGSQIFINGGGNYWTDWGAGLKINYGDSHNFQIFCTGLHGTLITHVKPMNGTPQLFATHYNNLNTTKAADGTLKAASPVIKIFSDGRAETNLESEGATVERLDVGQYLITGVLGMNSDAVWGGTDGGFDIPTDRNKQPLIWLDYEINADGSILVKTYHRTYPNAPAFARNEIKGVSEGEPVDVPADQFVSVRVEMPKDSAWNMEQEANRAAMEAAQQKAAQEKEAGIVPEGSL